MPFVLAASVALAWCFEDEANAATEAVLDRLGEDPAVVPAIWELEVANVLLVGERRGRLTEAQAARFVSLLSTLPINVDPVSPPMTTLLATGRLHKLSAYDAAYFVLAARDGIPLATQDDGLRSAATAAGVHLVIDDSDGTGADAQEPGAGNDSADL
jgi:predicted nucleic acid-binding protein